MLGGKLLGIGGTDKATKGENRKKVYMFAESANLWTYIGDFPAPSFNAAVAVVSSTEILVIGGWGGETVQERVNTVYKGILKLTDQKIGSHEYFLNQPLGADDNNKIT